MTEEDPYFRTSGIVQKYPKWPKRRRTPSCPLFEMSSCSSEQHFTIPRFEMHFYTDHERTFTLVIVKIDTIFSILPSNGKAIVAPDFGALTNFPVFLPRLMALLGGVNTSTLTPPHLGWLGDISTTTHASVRLGDAKTLHYVVVIFDTIIDDDEVV